MPCILKTLSANANSGAGTKTLYPRAWSKWSGAVVNRTNVLRTPPTGVGMKYTIALHKSDEGFSVSVPGLPGCWSQGATEQEALQNIQDAIVGYLAARDTLLEGAVVREI